VLDLALSLELNGVDLAMLDEAGDDNPLPR
jgi:hypothetical protein